MIIDKNTMLPRSFLAQALKTSELVGRIIYRNELGEAFAIGTGIIAMPGYLITCNHVVNTKKTALICEIWLDYFVKEDGSFAKKIKLDLAPDVYFVTSPRLDITIIAIDKQSQEYSRLNGRIELMILNSPIINGESLNIIHHPNGEPQQFSFRQGEVIESTEPYIHYTSPTSKGSSGAPLFNDLWELVGIHRSRIPERSKNGRVLLVNGGYFKSQTDSPSIKWKANQGVMIHSIQKWLTSIDSSLSRSLFGNLKRVSQYKLPNKLEIEPTFEEEEPLKRDAVFISFAHKDQKINKWQNRLELHLKTIPKIGERSVWQDSRIEPGEDWRNEIDIALKRTKVAVLLVGPNFLVSDFIMNKELPELLEAAKDHGVRIFPLITHHVAYKLSVLSRFQSFNDPENPLEDLVIGGNAEKILVKLVKKIADLY